LATNAAGISSVQVQLGGSLIPVRVRAALGLLRGLLSRLSVGGRPPRFEQM